MNGFRLLAAPAAFAAAVLVLVLTGEGALAPPPVDGFGRWLDDRGAVTAAMALLRLLALAAAGWLFLMTLTGAVAGMLGADRLGRAAAQATPPALRRALTALAGAGAAGSVLVGLTDPTTVGLAATGPPGERLVRLQDEAPPPIADPEATATMAVLPPNPEPPAATGAPVADRWTVTAGDSFWSIAEEVLADAWARPPSDAEVAPYWRALIDANRDRLVSPDPDLVLPGQAFTLPTPPAPPPA